MTNTLSLKTLDNLLLQSIAEMKLNRDPNIKISFRSTEYNDIYKKLKNRNTLKN